jgi:hypothetical protein
MRHLEVKNDERGLDSLRKIHSFQPVGSQEYIQVQRLNSCSQDIPDDAIIVCDDDTGNVFGADQNSLFLDWFAPKHSRIPEAGEHACEAISNQFMKS